MSLPQTYKALQAEGIDQPPKIVELPLPTPGKDEVLVKVAFAPINPAEIATIAGRIPVDPVPSPRFVGWEGSGIVAAVGENLKLTHKVGDRVHINAQAVMAEYILASSESFLPIQEGLSLEDASNHFINPATVVYMAIFAEQRGHKAVLHTAGASALGRQMIKYFKLRGLKLVNVIRRDDVIQELLDEGADYVLNSQSEGFEAKLKDILEKENVTLAYEAVCGSYTNTILKVMPPKSEIIISGALTGMVIHNLDIMELFKGKTIGGLFLYNYIGELAAKGGQTEVNKFITEVHSHLPGALKTNIQKVFKFADILEALAFYKTSNSSKGKILVQLNENL